jgi:proteasome accessory factor B
VGAKQERLVNLTVALLEARRPLTFAELRRRTGYYEHGDPESARRMFERDKDDLRVLGVPIETRALDAFETELGYTIDRAAYELPDVELTSEEVAALALALRAARADVDQLALRRLSARAPDPADLDEPAPTTVTLDPTPVEAVADAVVGGAPVRFAYRPASGEVATRTVDPYAVASRRGAWYLVGRDHDRDAVRAFRLDRVAGEIEVVGAPGSVNVPEDLDVAAHLHGPAEPEVAVEALVAPAVVWEAVARGARTSGDAGPGGVPVTFPATGPWRVRTWALGHGADVEVTAPAAVREDVAAALRAVARAHDPEMQA